MKKLTVFLMVVLGSINLAYGYKEPAPLIDVKVDPKVTFNASSGIYNYSYKVTNPSSNKESIFSIDLFIERNAQGDSELSSKGLQQCKLYVKASSKLAFEKRLMVPVGSVSPANWICGYGALKGYTAGSFGWGAVDDPYLIKPGSSLTDFSLSSYGLPGIRDILVAPAIDYDLLPPEYEGDVKKAMDLENRIKWMGKTIGPKAPPADFIAIKFIQYLTSIEEEAYSLGWVKDSHIQQSLVAKLRTIKKKLESNQTAAAKGVLGAFLAELDALKNKKLTAEGYDLLSLNAKYLLAQLNGTWHDRWK